MPLRRPENLSKNTLILFAIVLTYGVALTYGREYVDILLRKHGAPSWTHIAVIIALMVLWLGGGNLIYARLTRK